MCSLVTFKSAFRKILFLPWDRVSPHFLVFMLYFYIQQQIERMTLILSTEKWKGRRKHCVI